VTFTHDVEISLACVVDLINSDPDESGVDLLPDVESLQAFVVEHKLSDISQLTEKDLAAVHALRPRLRKVFVADTIAQAVSEVNKLLEGQRIAPQLTDHDDYPWHIHYFAPGSAVADHLLIDGAMALAVVMAAGEQERLQVCAAPDCQRVLVDLSRNRSKRYCDSRTCGNRLHVAAYRERRRAVGA
jgi:predicted RNA-binding Zn ribbon-like protein